MNKFITLSRLQLLPGLHLQYINSVIRDRARKNIQIQLHHEGVTHFSLTQIAVLIHLNHATDVNVITDFISKSGTIGFNRAWFAQAVTCPHSRNPAR